MPSLSASITPAQRTQLLDHGYLVVPELIDLATIDAVRHELHAVVSAIVNDLRAAGRIPNAFAHEDFDHQLARIARQDMALAREVIARVHGDKGEGGHMGPAIFQLLSHPRLLNAIEAIVGPEIIGSSVYRIRPKAPGLDKGAVPWHQDSGYLLSHCDKELIVTCWIPLVDATIDNGCLYVLPDAHKRGILTHHTGGPAGYLVIQDEDLPADLQPIPVPVPKGGVLMMTNLTPHASFLNQSDHMRWSIDLRYQGAGAPHNVDKLPGDIDPAGPAVEIACYPPEADFVLRSPSRPEKEVRTWEQLKAVRDEYFEHRHELKSFGGRWKPVTAAR